MDKEKLRKLLDTSDPEVQRRWCAYSAALHQRILDLDYEMMIVIAQMMILIQQQRRRRRFMMMMILDQCTAEEIEEQLGDQLTRKDRLRFAASVEGADEETRRRGRALLTNSVDEADEQPRRKKRKKKTNCSAKRKLQFSAAILDAID